MIEKISLPKQIELCSAYISYLKSGLAKAESNILIQLLQTNNLPAQAIALKFFIEQGEGWQLEIPLLQPWRGAKCFVGTLPPSSADLGDIWFDPYEISFMVRILNTPRIGGAPGWLAIEPILQWQYKAFLQLSKIELTNSPFLAVNDLFAREIMNGDKYISDIYEIEASIYTRWHGKRSAGGGALLIGLHYLSPEQLETIFPRGYAFWDPSIGGAEEMTGNYKSDAFRGKSEAEIRRSIEYIEERMQLEVCSEWFRRKDITMITYVYDQLGITKVTSYPIKDEYTILKNCSRKI